jgi:hypothetical protein
MMPERIGMRGSEQGKKQAKFLNQKIPINSKTMNLLIKV